MKFSTLEQNFAQLILRIEFKIVNLYINASFTALANCSL